MFYKPGDIILLKYNCRLANGHLLKDKLPDYIGQTALIVLAQIGYSNVRKQMYCHYKVKLTSEFAKLYGYFKVFHDDGVCIDKSYPRDEKIKQILNP